MNLEPHQFFIGKEVGSGEPLVYDGDDLTTHGVIVGMTGSGKTGLGIGLVEEALLNGIPCLVIDPKGDMGNLALVFPDLKGADFEPWVDPAEADETGKTVADLAAETAETWRKGLEGDGIDSERLRRIEETARVTVYTPGSAAGVGLNVLGSMRVPALSWDDAAEVIQDEIRSLVSSILTLAGIESDPVSGPEHILLSAIVEKMWRQGTDLDLATLVGQIPDPPVRKLGVFDIDTFISKDDRMKLALKLNGLLASPSFNAWMTGAPLDISEMLEGTPTKAAVVYLSHLSDEERQFLVTLLLSKMVTWIRSQPGTSRLRALIYMDEMYGFAPPTAAPPSKLPILTILKQARAHGVGMVVSTQNPVDLDYKAMANAGTWMIGRLQTENDKKRVLEGLDSAAGGADVAELSRLISGLSKRQFVLHTAKGGAPQVFGTRWAMSYLAGPMTRDQISDLMSGPAESVADAASAAAHSTPPGVDAPSGPMAEEDLVPVAPPVADGVPVTYLDPAAPWAGEVGAITGGTVHEAAVAARVGLLYDDTAAGVEHREEYEAVVFPLSGSLEPASIRSVDHDERDFQSEPPSSIAYRLPAVDLAATSFWKGLNGALKDHLVSNRALTVFRNPALKIYSRVGETEEDFVARCKEVAQEAADTALAKLRDKYAARIERVQDQLEAARVRMLTAEQELAASRQGEVLSGVGDLLGTFLGGRKRSNPLSQVASRRAATQKAKARAEAEATKVSGKERELDELEAELAEEITELTREQMELADQIETVSIPLEKTDIEVRDLKLVWVPVG
ncbi:MAG TPA: DUF87 domain-containing protein [Acidimicrobiia bacterium]